MKSATTAFLWRFGASTFKAAYGRYSGSTEYAKNYLQTDRGKVRDALAELLLHSGAAGTGVNVDIRWPSGSIATKFNIKNSGGDNRGEVYVSNGSTVETKRVVDPFTPGDIADRGKALIGSSNLPTEADANVLLQSIETANTKPWFMLVALAGEERTLHATMVLENPPPGKEHFGIDRQPTAIQEAIRQAAPSVFNLLVKFARPVRAGNVVEQIQDAFRRSPNVLLVGPPGCGKTVALEDIKALDDAPLFDPDRPDPWSRGSGKVFETAFHPGFSYENFVAGLAPRPGEGIQLEVRSGPLVNMAQWCRGSDREGLLVIDEFNRGPAAAIFGDTLVLLDKGKRQSTGAAGSSISQPHPDRDIDVPEEYAASDGDRRVPKRFTLPAGLKILGAFNSSDRSVAPLDAALLRRFAIVRVGPDPATLAKHLGVSDFDRSDVAYLAKEPGDWTGADVRHLSVRLLMVLNERLRAIVGEDHELGHALFWEVPADADLEATVAALAAEFEEKVVGRLRLTLRDKEEQLAAILNAPEAGGESDAGVAKWMEEDSRIGRLVGARLHIRDLKADPVHEQISRLVAVAQTET